MQRDRHRFELLSVHIDLREQESVIEYRKNPPARPFKQLSQIVILLVGGLVQDKFGNAEETIQGCAELVRDEVQELILRTIEDTQPRVSVGEFTCSCGYRFLQSLILPLQCAL